MRSVLIKVLIAYAVLFIGFFSDSAYAYLDPGTGSYIFQLFIAGVIGGLFAIKLFWNRIISFIKRLFIRNNNDRS